MNGPIMILIIGATVSISMYFAYLSQKSKDQAEFLKSRGGDGPTREEFEALNDQMAELAERVDFAERMLAQQREAARINQPREAQD